LFEQGTEMLDHLAGAMVIGDDVLQDVAHVFDSRVAGGNATEAGPSVGENRGQRLAELVDDRRRQLAHDRDAGDVGQLVAEALPFGLGPSPLADVDHRGDDELAVHAVNGIEADLDGNFAAVLPASKETPAGPHRTRWAIARELAPGLGGLVPEALRNERLDRQADEVVPSIAEDRPGFAVDPPNLLI